MTPLNHTKNSVAFHRGCRRRPEQTGVAVDAFGTCLFGILPFVLGIFFFFKNLSLQRITPPFIKCLAIKVKISRIQDIDFVYLFQEVQMIGLSRRSMWHCAQSKMVISSLELWRSRLPVLLPSVHKIPRVDCV